MVGPGVDESSYSGPGEHAKDRELAKAVKDGKAAVVVVRKTSPTLLRALRDSPPALLVLTGEANAEDLDDLRQLEDTWVLGPSAVVRVQPPQKRDGGHFICAHSRGELEGLTRAFRDEYLQCALSPTPRWLWQLLEDETLKACPVGGYIDLSALGSQWIRWSRSRSSTHALVPVGVRSPDLDEDDDAALLAAAAAHSLERWTGPVFPAPRVISLVLAGLRARLEPVTERAPSESELSVWMQAQRSLPVIGGALGMEFPSPGLNLAAPTSAFLAQRALVRAGDLQDALDRGHEGPPPPDVDGPARAQEIMRNAGETLTDQESKVVLRGYGFDVTRQAVANSASGASGFAERIGYPVVLKALSPDLRRRSEVGGVVLDLETSAAVRRGYAEIVDNIERLAPTSHLDGVLVSEMLTDGVDLRCGGRRLESGEVVLYGVLQGASMPLEPALALAPMAIPDAIALAHAVISRAPVRALRRETDPDLRGLADVFSRLGTLFAEIGPRLESVDLGPIRFNPERGYVVLDARITQQPHLQGD
jgi:hypothetical protein